MHYHNKLSKLLSISHTEQVAENEPSLTPSKYKFIDKEYWLEPRAQNGQQNMLSLQ